jgi:hypothetical protein
VVKKEEPKVVTPTPVVTPPVVKKEEPKVVTPTPVVTPPVVKKEEPKVVTPTPVVTPPVVKKEEPKVVTPTPVVTPPVVKKEEPKVVTPTPVVTPPVVKKEEPKVVTPTPVVTPPVVKKEEPKVVTPPTEDDPFGDVFTKTEPTATSAIKGTVIKSGTTESLNGTKLVLKANGKRVDSITTVVSGGFMFTKLAPGVNYEVYVSRKGYFDQKVTVNSSVLQPGQTGNIKVNLVLDPNQKDTPTESELVFVLKGKVVSDAGVAQPGAMVSITNNIDKTTIELKTNQQGEYTYNLRKQCHYTVKAYRGTTCKSDPFNKSTIGVQQSQTYDLELVIRCDK